MLQLCTPRLVGEPFRRSAACARDLAVVLRDPCVARWLRPSLHRPLGAVPTRGEVRALVDAHVRRWEEDGFGLWLVRHRAGGHVVGRGGLQRTLIDGRPEVEVGWAILASHWGRGLATELGAESLRLGFEALGLESIVAFTVPANVASRRVMEKLGMRPEATTVRAGLEQVVYRCRRDDRSPDG